MEFSLCFWALWTVKYGQFFTLVLFGHKDEKKGEKFHPENRIDFRISYLTVKRAQKKQNNSHNVS